MSDRRFPLKTAVVLLYLGVWLLSLAFYWFFLSPSDAMGFSLVFLWLLLPAAAFLLSILIGRYQLWGKAGWLAPLLFGLMYMLAEYATFGAGNMLSFHHLNLPEWSMLAKGAAVSLAGIVVGRTVFQRSSSK